MRSLVDGGSSRQAAMLEFCGTRGVSVSGQERTLDPAIVKLIDTKFSRAVGAIDAMRAAMENRVKRTDERDDRYISMICGMVEAMADLRRISVLEASKENDEPGKHVGSSPAVQRNDVVVTASRKDGDARPNDRGWRKGNLGDTCRALYRRMTR